MGSLSVKNVSEKFSRLDPCNMYSTLYTIYITYVQVQQTFYLLQAEQHWTGDLKCKEVKLDFAKRDKCKTGFSETLIGWNLEKPLMSLYETKWRERGNGL